MSFISVSGLNTSRLASLNSLEDHRKIEQLQYQKFQSFFEKNLITKSSFGSLTKGYITAPDQIRVHVVQKINAHWDSNPKYATVLLDTLIKFQQHSNLLEHQRYTVNDFVEMVLSKTSSDTPLRVLIRGEVLNKQTLLEKLPNSERLHELLPSRQRSRSRVIDDLPLSLNQLMPDFLPDTNE